MIVLDTHVWLFWVDDNLKALPRLALKTIQNVDTLGISIISCWEIAMLVAKQRLAFNIDVQAWVDQALQYPGVLLLDLDPEIAVLSARLPGKFHGDPADRIIVATCMKYGCPLITKDRKIRSWGKIKTIWSTSTTPI